jgi:prefoldin subunit 5
MSNGNRTVTQATGSVVAVPVSAEAYRANAEILDSYIEELQKLKNVNDAGLQLWHETRNNIAEAAQKAAQDEEAARQRRLEAE